MTTEVREGVALLPDGRRLGYCDTGALDARPVLLTHGSPGSRRFVPPDTPDDVRLITFDRPGYGTSDPAPGRTVLTTAADAVALLDALAVERVAVVGWSGGCPTVAALLVLLGADRVDGAALVSGPGPIDEVPAAWELLGERRRPSAERTQRGPRATAGGRPDPTRRCVPSAGTRPRRRPCARRRRARRSEWRRAIQTAHAASRASRARRRFPRRRAARHARTPCPACRARHSR